MRKEDISITVADGRTAIAVPWNHAIFNSVMRRCGGEYQEPSGRVPYAKWPKMVPPKGVWMIPAEDLSYAREGLFKAYGTDGSIDPDVVSVRCYVDTTRWQAPVDIMYRYVAWAHGRGVRLGVGVSKLAGTVVGAGSGVHRRTIVNATIVIQDMPRAYAERLFKHGSFGLSHAVPYDPEAWLREVAEEEAAALRSDVT